ncbi:MAG: hypothetical protein K0R24_436 [Gammaproteobacteria bacterium]|nr:hypothetical protein [Gammaproteobacteria bacterium]
MIALNCRTVWLQQIKPQLAEEVASLAMPANSTSLATSPSSKLAPAEIQLLQSSGYGLTTHTLFAAPKIIPETFPTSNVVPSPYFSQTSEPNIYDIYLFCMIGLATSMRLSEILSIRLEDINTEQSWILYFSCKSRCKTQSITPDLADYLAGYLKTWPRNKDGYFLLRNQKAVKTDFSTL